MALMCFVLFAVVLPLQFSILKFPLRHGENLLHRFAEFFGWFWLGRSRHDFTISPNIRCLQETQWFQGTTLICGCAFSYAFWYSRRTCTQYATDQRSRAADAITAAIVRANFISRAVFYSKLFDVIDFRRFINPFRSDSSEILMEGAN